MAIEGGYGPPGDTSACAGVGGGRGGVRRAGVRAYDAALTALNRRCPICHSDESEDPSGQEKPDLRIAQRLAWANKVAKGFNTTDVPLEFCLLQGEVAEAFDAWRKGRQDVGEELADIAIYLLSLAEMLGVDLQDAVEAKLAKNVARAYEPLTNGTLVKAEPSEIADVPPEGVLAPGKPGFLPPDER